MKRIISCSASDFRSADKKEIKNAILQSEGRVVLAQTVVKSECMVSGISNAETLGAFGADLVLLKGFDTEHPVINGIKTDEKKVVKELQKLSGRLIGINLEVVANGFVHEDGSKLSEQSLKATIALEPDFLCITAYRNPKNTSEVVLGAIKLVRKHYDGLLIVNKYGNAKEIFGDTNYKAYVHAGADVLTLPMPGSVAGIQVSNLSVIATQIKEAGALVSMGVSTSQEGSDEATIKSLAIKAKEAGADMYDFGDANQNGMAAVENITALSIAVRGKRHTYFRICGSAAR